MYPKIRRFLKEYLPGKGTLYFWGIFFLVITVLCTTLLPIYIRNGVNILSENQFLSSIEKSALATEAWWIVGLALLMLISRFLSRVYIFLPGRQIESQLREDLFSSTISLPEAEANHYASGDLISRGTNDVNGVRVMISMGVLHTVNSSLMLILSLYFMISINLKMTIICLLPVPFIIWLTRSLSRQMILAARESQASLGALSEQIREQFKAHSLLAIFPVFSPLFARVQKSNNHNTHKAEKWMLIRVYMMASFAVLTSFCLFALLYFGGREAMLGEDFDLGDFVAFSLYLGLLQGPLRAVGWLISIAQRGEVALERIYQLRDSANEMKEIDTQRELQTEAVLSQQFQASEPILKLENLNYRYTQESPFELKIDSLHLEKGKTYGIFGSTGSGKSTLLKLLSGNLRSKNGSLSIEGVHFDRINSEVLSRQFSFLSQENSHFSGTIRYNIDLLESTKPPSDKSVCSFEEAYDVSQLAQDIAQFPDGLDTVLGEHGINLSGGQKQRLALLRSLLRPRRILMLDDFVSAVDHRTEEAILNRLFKVLKGQTAILISHRISALKDCDQILVLDEGQLVAQGTHAELLASHDSYSETYRYQSVKAQLEQINHE